jgi:maleylacetoacetate isomerase
MAAAEASSKRSRDGESNTPASSSSGSEAEQPVLYSYWRSSSSWRVRIVLALKNIEYKYEAKHLLHGEQLEDGYAEMNPMRELPTLLIDGLTLTQSPAIIEYLDETRPGPCSLLPKDAAGRAHVRALVQTVACDIQPVQNLRVLQKVMAEHEDPALKTKKKLEWGKWAIEIGFNGLEASLAKTAGKYAYGDEITLADVFIVPQVYNADRFGVDMSAYPIISRVSAAAALLPAFKAADPSMMPDKF